jgi:hypothetical protein
MYTRKVFPGYAVVAVGWIKFGLIVSFPRQGELVGEMSIDPHSCS